MSYFNISTPNVIRVIKIKEDEMGRACSTQKMGNACKIMVGKRERMT
jgi:hypothetical protein